jgi:hypothetical protein
MTVHLTAAADYSPVATATAAQSYRENIGDFAISLASESVF